MASKVRLIPSNEEVEKIKHLVDLEHLEHHFNQRCETLISILRERSPGCKVSDALTFEENSQQHQQLLLHITKSASRARSLFQEVIFNNLGNTKTYELKLVECISDKCKSVVLTLLFKEFPIRGIWVTKFMFPPTNKLVCLIY